MAERINQPTYDNFFGWLGERTDGWIKASKRMGKVAEWNIATAKSLVNHSAIRVHL